MRLLRRVSVLLSAGLLLPLACSRHSRPTSNIVVPATPGSVQAAAGDGTVTLQWAAAANAASYCAYYAASPDVSPANWGTLPEGHRLAPVASPLVVGGLTNGTTYTFVVTAWNAAGDLESAPSSPVQATPVAAVAPGWTAPLTQPPLAVTGTTATLAGRFTNPDGYTTTVWFEYGTTASYGINTAGQQFAAAGSIDVTAPLAALQPTTTYHYRFVTENAGGRFAGTDRSCTTLAEPQVLLANLDAPAGLCYDGTSTFLFEIYGGRLRRVDPSTGAATTLATVGTHGNGGTVAVLGSTVWFADAMALYRVGTDGSGFATIGAVAEISEILAHASGLYVRHGQSISWFDLAGSPVATLYVRTPQGSEGFGGGIAVDATHLYWTDYWSGTVEKLAFAAGPKVVLAVGQNHPGRLWLEGDTLWFATDDGLRRLAAAGGVVLPVSTATGDFTKVGDTIYVTNATDVLAIAAATGAVTTLATGADAAGRPVVTGDRILWLQRGSQYEPPLGAMLWIARP